MLLHELLRWNRIFFRVLSSDRPEGAPRAASQVDDRGIVSLATSVLYVVAAVRTFSCKYYGDRGAIDSAPCLCLAHSGQQPIEYAYWSVNSLGYDISIYIARCNRRVELFIDTYFFTNRFKEICTIHYCSQDRCEIFYRPVYLTNMLRETGTIGYCSWIGM